jgi:alkylation response protein AidB-like acyl-CoA dehydrogenase
MLDFSPTAEQDEIRALAHSLAVDYLRPQARAAEARADIEPELMKTLAQTGLTTPFAEDLDGSGEIEAVTYVIIAEELGFGDGALALNIFGSMMGPLAVALIGNQQQQGQYVYPFCDRHEGYRARGSLAFAEHTGGYTLTDINATALRSGDNYILNGTKREVIHGAQSNPRVALFRLEGTSGPDGLCTLLLPQQVEGMSVALDIHKLGMIAAPSASYRFENASVPVHALLGEVGSHGVVRVTTLYNLLRAGIACGMTRAALEYASAYAEERIAFGRPIVSYQGIAFILAEMAMKLDAVRLLLWNAATNWDRADDITQISRDAEAAHYQALQLVKSATIDAVQVLGGAGFMQDHPVEMWMRNAAAME